MERVSFESVVTTICEVYGYRLHDIYSKSFKEGGLTQGQIEVLFKDYQERFYNQMVFQAGIHGVDLKEGSEGKTEKKEETGHQMPAFQSPEEYEQLPKEERDALTKKMMGTHKLKFG